MAKIGFIGCGNMGGAIARSMRKAVWPKDLLLADASRPKAEALAAELGCTVAGSNQELASGCAWLVLAVKPQYMQAMLAEIAPVLAARKDRFVLLTMAAGLSIDTILAWAGGDYPVVRIMPNTPAGIGQGCTVYAHQGLTEEEIQRFTGLLAPAGLLDPLPENLIDAAGALSGSGPAFVYLFMEALADGAVHCGMPRDKALRYAAQTVAGAAAMVLESGRHPGELKDAVCSPGGTTIAGIRTLEEKGFRAAAMDAVISAFEKTKGL